MIKRIIKFLTKPIRRKKLVEKIVRKYNLQKFERYSGKKINYDLFFREFDINTGKPTSYAIRGSYAYGSYIITRKELKSICLQ